MSYRFCAVLLFAESVFYTHSSNTALAQSLDDISTASNWSTAALNGNRVDYFDPTSLQLVHQKPRQLKSISRKPVQSPKARHIRKHNSHNDVTKVDPHIKVKYKRAVTAPVYVFTHVPKASGENALALMVDINAGAAILTGKLVSCVPHSRSALGATPAPFEKLRARDCNFVFAHQKHLATMDKVRAVVDKRARIYTFTLIREPVARAISAYFFGTPRPPACENFVPEPICKNGVGAMATAECAFTKCWGVDNNQPFCAPSYGPLFGELLKFYFSTDCLDTKPNGGALEAAIETLHNIDVVGLTEEQDASFCILFWIWDFKDIFRRYCGDGNQLPRNVKRVNKSRTHVGISNSTTAAYTKAIPEELEVYSSGIHIFEGLVRTVTNNSGVEIRTHRNS